jgi:hypothetical protein
MLRMTEEIGSLILERAPDLKIFEAARRGGLTSLREECLSLVSKGETTLEDVLRVTQDRYCRVLGARCSVLGCWVLRARCLVRVRVLGAVSRCGSL